MSPISSVNTTSTSPTHGATPPRWTTNKITLSSARCMSPEPGSPEYEAMSLKRLAYMAIVHVGGILWLATCNMTRFDLSYAASQLARYVSNPGEEHFKAAVRVLVPLP